MINTYYDPRKTKLKTTIKLIPSNTIILHGQFYVNSNTPANQKMVDAGDQQNDCSCSSIHESIVLFLNEVSKHSSAGRQSSTVCSVKGFRYFLSSILARTKAYKPCVTSVLGHGSVSYRPKTRHVTHFSRGPIAKKKFSLVPIGFWRKPVFGSLRVSRYMLSLPPRNHNSLRSINSNFIYMSGVVANAGGSAMRCTNATSFLSVI